MSFFKKLFGTNDEKKPEPPGEKIYLNVYDLNPDGQQQMPFGMGVYHSGVQIGGVGMFSSPD